MTMIQDSYTRLDELCQIAPALLKEIPAEDLAARPAHGGWSKLEIIGHLVDSAANNQQRFVRGQFESVPVISYDSDQWVKHNYYQCGDKDQLIALWTAYNQHLAMMLRHIPEDVLQQKVHTGTDSYSIDYLAADYVAHLEHHLRQIISY